MLAQNVDIEEEIKKISILENRADTLEEKGEYLKAIEIYSGILEKYDYYFRDFYRSSHSLSKEGILFKIGYASLLFARETASQSEKKVYFKKASQHMKDVIRMNPHLGEPFLILGVMDL